jgi:guanosine-3',5'-bis(diphosphate) 3'-pyrophosphohydrolase
MNLRARSGLLKAVEFAAIVHDTIEDTATTPDELEARFGRSVRDIVAEVTDDKMLDKAIRKPRQVEHAPHLSHCARAIKVADKSP